MQKQKLHQYLKYIAINILIAAFLSLLIVKYVISAYRIEGASMISILLSGERVLISKPAAKYGSIKRFDIVVFRKPDEPGKTIIKRIIGLPGEIIEIRAGQVYIDSKKIEQPFLDKWAAPLSQKGPGSPELNIPGKKNNIPGALSFHIDKKEKDIYAGNMNPLLIRKGHYFLMGDNRPVSLDSRDFGEVPLNYIIGKAIFRYWPLSRIGAIK